MRGPVIGVFLALALMAGCRTRLVPYESAAELTSAEAQRIVMEVVEQQPRAFAPLVVEVTDDKLAVTLRDQTRTVVYFLSMGEANIYKDRRGNYYFVLILDGGSRNRIRVWTPELVRATRLVDGLTAMREYAIARASDPSRQGAEDRLERLRRIREEMEAVRREQIEEQQKRLEMEVEKPSDEVAE